MMFCNSESEIIIQAIVSMKAAFVPAMVEATPCKNLLIGKGRFTTLNFRSVASAMSFLSLK